MEPRSDYSISVLKFRAENSEKAVRPRMLSFSSYLYTRPEVCLSMDQRSVLKFQELLVG